MNDTAIHLGRLAERVVRIEPRRVKQALLDEIVLALRAGERALLDPIAHGPFFDGLKDMPYGGTRQTTQPIETPDDALAAIQELRAPNGECCTCLSISRDPLCVHHGDVNKVASVNHGPTLQEAQKTVADHYGAGWVSMAELYQRAQERVAFYERHTDKQANELVTVRLAAQAVYDTFTRDEAAGYHSRDREYALAILGRVLTP